MLVKKTNILQQTDKKLSVLIDQDGLSFLLYTSSGLEKSIVKNFKHESNPIEILNEIEDIYQQEPLLKEGVNDISVIYHHPIFTGVPDSIFKEGHDADYLKYNTRLLETDIISHDNPIKDLDYRTVYIAYSNINNYFYDLYGTFNYYHYATLALQQHKEKYPETPQLVLIDIKKSHFYLTIIDKGKLKVHNCFIHQSPEDVLYYTLFTAQHNAMDPETMNLKILTDTKNESLYDLLYTYVRHVEYIEDSTNYSQEILCV